MRLRVGCSRRRYAYGLPLSVPALVRVLVLRDAAAAARPAARALATCGALEVGNRASVSTGVSRERKGLTGCWVVLFKRAAVQDPAGPVSTRPIVPRVLLSASSNA